MFPAGASMTPCLHADDRFRLTGWSAVVFLALVAFGGGLCGCNGGSRADAHPAAPPVPVMVTAVSSKDVPVEVRAVGTAEAVNTVQVLPQVSGLIQEVHFREGDTVKKGQLLFT